MLAALLLNVVLMASPARQVEVRLGPVHADILAASERFLDVEGALRSAKTWTILIKVRRSLEEHPGIRWAIARWTDGDLNQKLIPDYRNVCALMGLPHGTWNAKESCYDLPNGSRLYCVHLKSSKTDNKYAAVRGLTVAGFYIDQLEEVPEDVYGEAALRLSQPGFPQQMIVSPNPVPDNHWIAKRWPTTNPDRQHRYISLSIWDNRHNLDASTIEAAEALYPVGHPLRRVKLEGKRGLDVRGKPVYTGAFMRDRHVRALGLHPGLPLLEAYDYGFHHPCVVWAQWAPWGHFWVLGGVMGSDLHLDAFLPVVERYRQQWFPNRLRLDVTCDPAGAANNSQGLRGTPVGMLRDWYQANGERDATGAFVVPQYLPDANHPERRTAANQRIATYMRRQVQQEEAFLVDPERWALVELGSEKADTWFVDGLEAGYVFEDKPRFSATLGTYSLAKKDGFFEHGQNCLEYLAQMFVLDLPQSNEQALKTQATHAAKLVRDNERAASKALRAAQKDVDPEDRPTNRYGFAGRRVMARRAVGRRFR